MLPCVTMEGSHTQETGALTVIECLYTGFIECKGEWWCVLDIHALCWA